MRAMWLVVGGFVAILVVVAAAGMRAEQIGRERNAQPFAYYVTYYAKLGQDMQEHLPVGTSAGQIVAYLQQKGITYSYYPEDGEILILFKDVAKSWMFSTDIQVVIMLNEQNRLQSIVFRKVNTGP